MRSSDLQRAEEQGESRLERSNFRVSLLSKEMLKPLEQVESGQDWLGQIGSRTVE